MAETEAAKEGAAILATVIGELMEDHVPAALRKPDDGLDGYGHLALCLGQIGDDIAVLAAAIDVLVRRSGPSG